MVLNNGNVIPIGEQNGSLGQGNPDPRFEFENHAIVKFDGKYYNPSYGSSIASNTNSWETPALAGFGGMVYFLNNGTLYRINWIGHLNDGSQQSNVSP